MPAPPPRRAASALRTRPAHSPAATDGADPGPARGHRRPGQAFTRKHVLGTVYELISEDGIENLSMRKVAHATGLSTGTINYHFGNKQRLLIAALESAYQLPDDWDRYSGSPGRQLERLMQGHICRSPKDRFWRFWLNYLAGSLRDGDLMAHQVERFSKQHRFWTRLIADGIAAGEFDPALDPAQKAEELLVLVHGLVVHQLASPGPRQQELAREMLQRLLQSLRPPG